MDRVIPVRINNFKSGLATSFIRRMKYHLHYTRVK